MKKAATLYVLSFLLPVFILSFVLGGIIQVYPIGNYTLLKTDLFHQYVHFYGYFKDALLGKDSLMYNWHAGLGTNHIGNVAYYTSSPLMFLVVFFSKINLTEFVLLLLLLKVGLSALSICHLLRKKFNKLNQIEIVVFSTFYALMSYIVVYYYNLMWLDVIIWLPLLVLATDILIKNKRIAPFTLFLAITFISNFYMSYMVGLFIAIYFLVELFKRQNVRDISEMFHIGLKFLMGTFIAASLSAFLTLPTLFQLLEAENGKGTIASFFNTDVFLMFHKLFIAMYDSVENGSPNIYIGTFVLLLVPYFFLTPRIKRAEKIGWGIILLILVLSMFSTHINFAWHGFDQPNWFPYRYSFLLSFTIFYMSVSAYQFITRLSVKKFIIYYAFAITLTAIHAVYYENFIINAVFITIFSVFLLLKIKRYNKLIYTLLLIYTFGELTMNTTLTFTHLTTDIGGISKKYYAVYEDYKQAREHIKDFDPAVGYRLETDINKSYNDSQYVGHSSFNYFSSMLNGELASSLKALGLSTRKAKYNDQGTTLFTESFLGEKYYITSEELQRSGYEKVANFKDLFIYENKEALPLGFVVNDRIAEINIDDAVHSFALQNEIMQKAVNDEKLRIFKPFKPMVIEYKNAKVIGGDDIHLIRHNNEGPIEVKYVFFFQSKKQLYTWMNASTSKDVKVKINGEEVAEYPSMQHKGILDLGSFERMQVTVSYEFEKDEVVIKDLLFYVNSFQDIQSSLGQLNEHLEHIEISENQLSASVKTNFHNRMVLLTIPYDPGWKITVDGNVVEGKEVIGSFIGVPISKGEHEIVLSFIPKGFKAGVLISILGLILFVFIFFSERKTRRLQRRDKIEK